VIPFRVPVAPPPTLASVLPPSPFATPLSSQPIHVLRPTFAPFPFAVSPILTSIVAPFHFTVFAFPFPPFLSVPFAVAEFTAAFSEFTLPPFFAAVPAPSSSPTQPLCSFAKSTAAFRNFEARNR
jgi:hypothetical protein